MNLKRSLDFWKSIYEENCKKYAQATQKSFTKSLKTVLTEGLARPLPVRNGQPTIEFKKNKITGHYDLIRIRKKRKNMEIEVCETQQLSQRLSTQSFQDDKQRMVKPQLKKQKDYQLKRASATPPITIRLQTNKMSETNSQKSQKKKVGIFVDKLGESPKEESEVSRVSRTKILPIRNLIFEEDKHCNRSTDTDSGMGDGKMQALRGTQEKCSQTSGTKQEKVLFRADSCSQTSPLRVKNMPGFNNTPQKIFEEVKENSDIMKSSSSKKILLEQTRIEINKKVEKQVFSKKPEEIEGEKSEEKKIDLSASNIRIDNKPENNLAHEAKITEQESIIQTESQPEVPKIDIKKNIITTKPLFSPPRIQQNQNPSPLNFGINPSFNNIKKIQPERVEKIETPFEKVEKVEKVEPNLVQALPKFDFLKTSVAQESLVNQVNESNPFLAPKTISTKGNTENNLTTLKNNQPDASGIFGLIERNSSEKKQISGFDGGLKMVGNLEVFGNMRNQSQNMLATNVVTPNSNQTSDNRLFRQNGMSESHINAIHNQSLVQTPLFGNRNSNVAFTTHQQQPLNLFSKPSYQDQMEVTETKPSNSIRTNLFGPTEQITPINNTNLFRNQNSDMGNNLFSNQNNSSMMGNNGPSNNLFSNNLFGGNNNMNSSTGSIFSQQNNGLNFNNPVGMQNSQPLSNLFAPQNNNNSGFINPQPRGNNHQNQTSLNLFGPMETTNNTNNNPNKLVFSNDSESLFGKPVGMPNNNNNNMNQFNNNFMSQPFGNNNSSSFFGGEQKTSQDAANFLGFGKNEPSNNSSDPNQSNLNRVYRRLTQIGAKNKERAF